MISAVAWVIAGAAWLVILLSPVALVALAVVPSWRRWWLRPLLRRVTGRRPELLGARTGVLEMEVYGSSDLASAFPPEYRHMADKQCAVCGGPLGYPFATTGRGNECRSCGIVTALGGGGGGGAYANSVAPAGLHLDECSRAADCICSRTIGGMPCTSPECVRLDLPARRWTGRGYVTADLTWRQARDQGYTEEEIGLGRLT